MAKKVLHCLSDEGKETSAEGSSENKHVTLQLPWCISTIPCNKNLTRNISCYILKVSDANCAAFDWCASVVKLFVLLSNKYAPFLSSTKPWPVLKSYLDLESTVPVHLCGARYEAHATTTSAMAKSCNSVIDALSHIHTMIVKKVIQDEDIDFFQRK
jgi:hypothetical protein